MPVGILGSSVDQYAVIEFCAPPNAAKSVLGDIEIGRHAYVAVDLAGLANDMDDPSESLPEGEPVQLLNSADLIDAFAEAIFHHGGAELRFDQQSTGLAIFRYDEAARPFENSGVADNADARA